MRRRIALGLVTEGMKSRYLRVINKNKGGARSEEEEGGWGGGAPANTDQHLVTSTCSDDLVGFMVASETTTKQTKGEKHF